MIIKSIAKTATIIVSTLLISQAFSSTYSKYVTLRSLNDKTNAGYCYLELKCNLQSNKLTLKNVTSSDISVVTQQKYAASMFKNGINFCTLSGKKAKSTTLKKLATSIVRYNKDKGAVTIESSSYDAPKCEQQNCNSETSDVLFMASLNQSPTSSRFSACVCDVTGAVAKSFSAIHIN